MTNSSPTPDEPDLRTTPIMLGIDVGSTTVKIAAVDPETQQILWADYQRHQTKQAEWVLDLLVEVGKRFPNIPAGGIRAFITGSGSGPLVAPVGAKFVQEVNAVTLAVEKLHPDVGSVVELGGQDAKIIIFKEAVDDQGQPTGKTAIASMNDKCASGTGATIDKCFIKVGMPSKDAMVLRFDDRKLHHVAAKCGVFAETDIVNLVKSAIPSHEIMCSLADAIVMQNLSVLTRGNTLRHKVLLLGGPNTYLPFLQDCWRKRIPQTWDERGYNYPKDVPVEELIIVPQNSQYYAAFGAVMYGLHEDASVGVYRGLDPLKEFIQSGRKSKLGESAGPPLARTNDELSLFREQYKIPKFVPPALEPGTHIRAVIGMDGGSTSSKAVLVDEQKNIIKKEYQLSKGNPIQDVKEILTRIKQWVADQQCTLEVLGFGATGYAADVLDKTVKSDVNIVETVAHMMSATTFFGDVDVICDIGGQDIKVLFMQNGDIKNFRLSNQCSAGNGMLLQAMADQFGVPITEYADVAFGAELSPKFSYGCAVFLDSDRVNFQKEGYAKEELLAGLAQVLPKNVWQYVVQIPRMASLGKKFVLQGGTQYNQAAVKAQVDYIKDRVPGAEVYVHPHCGEAGALGAAFETLRVVKRRGHSTFIGLEAAANIEFEAKNDESTRCHFCPNNCARTFIDSRTPDGDTARYISGFSCEKGTVESEEAMLALTADRKKAAKSYPNLVDVESKMLFRHIHDSTPMPADGEMVKDTEVTKTLLGAKRVEVERPFRRSPAASVEARRRIRIGIPKMLNIWSTAPFWRAYFESLGIQKQNVVFSDDTTEEIWAEGGKYGSIDPCYPSKVGQAHIHNLLFHQHSDDKPLKFIFNPTMTHVPSFIENAMDHSSCPIVAGAPNVLKAAFTKETDFFAVRGIEYVDPACSLIEPNLLRKQMFSAWGERLGVTEDESDHAVKDGFAALDKIDAEMQKRGKAILEQVEKEDRVAILMIGRPYHLDPGLNHAIPEEFQILGFPILSIRSIPKDKEWLAKYFGEDLKSGKIQTPLEINDVWPENYSANSAQKVWAVKFAAHHPNVALLDLSSFKCGHDAPTYGIIDSIVAAAGTPYSALHDIDANKPGGSIKIRVKTYTHSLGLHKERLDDVAERRAELAHRIDQKRLELLGMKAKQLAERSQKDESLEKMIQDVTDRVRAYEAAKRPTISEEAERAADAEALARAGVVKMGIKRAGDETGAHLGEHMATVKETNAFKLPILGEGLGESDIDAQLKAFEQEEAAKLGLKTEATDHWVDKMISPEFKASKRAETTLLISGLTRAHDYLIQGGLKGLGYKVEVIDVPDNDALRYGKEFGNRGQCNPTYFTVGNLVKFLTERAARDGISQQEAVDKYVFVTAGACGPCRFGMYATEYRKALRDAGFDGFRVLLFQQKGGLKQATGDEAGLVMNPKFFLTLLTAIIAGDVINGMGYRLRPFEIEAGATERVIDQTKKWVHEALTQRKSVLRALWRARAEFAKVKCDWTRPAPRVSIIGEFWAMTTEGDGNYQLQSFLEQEGAECDIQFVTNWLLFMLWEGRYDTKLRAELRGLDTAKKSLKDAAFGKKLFGLFVADLAIRGAFHTFGAAIGYHGYHLPEMDVIAETANKYYNNQVRGGEGHMEVGKFILNVLHNKTHMTLSVKPFGCMPSSGVSDGVQSMITGLYPQSIFCAIETSGDGKVNVHSRVQMFLFKARLAAQKEYAEALERYGVTAEQVKAFQDAHPHFGSSLHRAPHAAAGTAADRLAEIAPYLGKSETQIRVLRAKAALSTVAAGLKAAPGFIAGLRKKLVERAPVLVAQAREEWKDARPGIEQKARETVTAGINKIRRRPAAGAEVRASA